MDAVRTGSARLDDAARALARLRECYRLIDSACGAASALVARPESVAALAAAHAAATDALRGAEAVAALPAEAARAEAMLAGGARLSQVHECLAALEGTAAAAQRSLEVAARGERAAAAAEAAAAAAAAAAGGPPSPSVAATTTIATATTTTPPPAPSPAPAPDSLAPYLDRVRRAGRQFEDRLWATVRGFRVLGRTRPAALVDAARVIEAQEAVDRHLEAAGPGAPRPKRWWARAQAQAAMAVQDAFAPLLAACSRLGAAGADTDGCVRAILGDAQAFVVDLAAVSDYAAPCFARRDAFFGAAARAVHDGIAAALEALAAAAGGCLANADILAVLAWTDAYVATLDDLGVGHLAYGGGGGGGGGEGGGGRGGVSPLFPRPARPHRPRLRVGVRLRRPGQGRPGRVDPHHAGRRPGGPAGPGRGRPAVDARGGRLLPVGQRAAGRGGGGEGEGGEGGGRVAWFVCACMCVCGHGRAGRGLAHERERAPRGPTPLL